MEYRILGKESLEEMVELMAMCNGKDEQYIPYCARRKESIRRDMEEMLVDDNLVIGAEVNSRLVGMLALNIDQPKKWAEVIAFFIDTKDEVVWRKIGQELFDKIQEHTKALEQYLFYVGGKNKRLIEFLEVNKAEYKGEEFTLELRREVYKEKNNQDINRGEMQVGMKEELIKLHDTIFPKAYYSGEELIQKLNENNRVFIEYKEGITGYCYGELYKDTKWGYIHFLGVDEKERGKGIGRKLVEQATQWLMEENVDKVSMTVEAVNEKALGLYMSVGYSISARNKSYHYQLKKDEV